MSELVIDFITSLDGFGAAKEWPGLWGLGGPEYYKWLEEQPERDYTVLMGAKTYQIMSEIQNENSGENVGEDSLAKAQKIVFSSTLQPPFALPNTQLINGDAVEAVKKMKQDGSSSMITLGSLSLCRSLLNAGLVDRYRVVVFPVITGRTGYDRIYDGYPDVALELVNNRVFDGRLQLLEYVPRIVTTPPGADSRS